MVTREIVAFDSKMFFKKDENMFHQIVTIIAYNLTHSTMPNRQADRAISYLLVELVEKFTYFHVCCVNDCSMDEDASETRYTQNPKFR